MYSTHSSADHPPELWKDTTKVNPSKTKRKNQETNRKREKGITEKNRKREKGITETNRKREKGREKGKGNSASFQTLGYS